MLGTFLHSSIYTNKIVTTVDFVSKVHIILLDIEGTTTNVDFVYLTLFPYANQRLETFLRHHYSEPEIKSLVQDLYKQHQLDEDQGLQPSVWTNKTEESELNSVVKYCRWMMSNDRKFSALKTLQGKIWYDGYYNGELDGEVYSDVPSAFDRWRRQNREICIYSSGSVLAQRLLFSTVPSGDLTKYISAFFDTGVGTKTESKSYKNIASLMSSSSKDFLFISDTINEILAAQEAGMQAILCKRSMYGFESSQSNNNVIKTFEEIFPD
ncbi:MAG TPA: acireductone synthase [Nitrososphaeraceae archaeon]|nr:acireductone synthase [Nitrososphaeraceae archaeon]